MKSYLSILIIILLLLSLGCTKEINFDMSDQEPVPVLNCIFEEGKPFKFELTLSSSIFASTFERIDDAIILLFENDDMVDSLYYNEGFYYSNCLPKANNTYKVIVKLPDGKILEAEDKIPLKSEILYFTFQDSVMFDDEYYLSMAEISILANSLDLKYYEIVMYAKYDFVNMQQDTIDKLLKLRFSETKNHDPVLVESGLLAYDNSSLLFSNNYFAGNEHVVKALYTNGLPINANGEYRDHDIIVVLRSISEDYFEYCKQLAIYNANTETILESGGTALENPVFLYSNVKGGKGIFAGFSSDLDTVPKSKSQ